MRDQTEEIAANTGVIVGIEEPKLTDRDVTEHLQRELERVPELEKTIKELVAKLQASELSLGQRTSEVRSLEQLVKRDEDLKSRERDVANREVILKQQEELNNVRLECERDKTMSMRDTLSLVFRNSSLRKNRVFQAEVPTFELKMDPEGTYHSHQSGSVTEQRVEEISESED